MNGAKEGSVQYFGSKFIWDRAVTPALWHALQYAIYIPHPHSFAVMLQDAPGTWTKHMHESHSVPFYYNQQTGRSQFMTPVSCSWFKAMLDGHPVYTNSITHQAVWKRPPALSWKLLYAPGDREACDFVSS